MMKLLKSIISIVGQILHNDGHAVSHYERQYTAPAKKKD